MTSNNAGRPGLLLLSYLCTLVKHRLTIVIGGETGCLFIEFAQDFDSLILVFLRELLMLILSPPTISYFHLKNIVICLSHRITAFSGARHSWTHGFQLQPFLFQGYLVVLTLDTTEVFLHPVLEAVDSIDSPNIGILHLE